MPSVLMVKNSRSFELTDAPPGPPGESCNLGDVLAAAERALSAQHAVAAAASPFQKFIGARSGSGQGVAVILRGL